MVVTTTAAFLREPPPLPPWKTTITFSPPFKRNTLSARSLRTAPPPAASTACMKFPSRYHYSFRRRWPAARIITSKLLSFYSSDIHHLFDSFLQTFSLLRKAPTIAAAVLLGLLLTANPSAADARTSSHWQSPSWNSSVPLPHYFATPHFGCQGDCFMAAVSGHENSFLAHLLLLMGSAALVVLLPWSPNASGDDYWIAPELQVCSFTTTLLPLRDLLWIGEAEDILGLGNGLIAHFNTWTNLTSHLVFPGLLFTEGRRFGFEWNEQTKISRKINFQEPSFDNHCSGLVKAVATVEHRCLAPSNDSDEYYTSLMFCANSDTQVAQCSDKESAEIDDREKLRRMRISKANKGNVPWNKGRKHSAETIQRIRERTRLAMLDPKVKMKLVNLGHSQSEETRMKIGAGVREGWQRRREKLVVQEGCFFQWQNSIAEAARRGCVGEDELQWHSYKILDEQLKQEWLESIEKRKTMPRPKGSKRAPKSPEQRRKISEAIAAKWADPAYRDRVCSALAKHHGTTVGAQRKQRKKHSGETLARDPIKKKPMKPDNINYEAISIKRAISKRKRNSTPLYKDPMASSKLDMIKKIREQRTVLETKKREAMERAKLLIAEAEKAAKALEIAALKNPLAQASLLETRKLISEATRSIENIETAPLTSQEIRDNASLDAGSQPNHNQNTLATPSSENLIHEQHINGFHYLSSSSRIYWDFDKLTLKAAPTECVEKTTEVISDNVSYLLPAVVEQSETKESQMDQSVVSTNSGNKNIKPKKEEVGSLEVENCQTSKASSVNVKKKWVRGRLMEVKGEMEENGLGRDKQKCIAGKQLD